MPSIQLTLSWAAFVVRHTARRRQRLGQTDGGRARADAAQEEGARKRAIEREICHVLYVPDPELSRTDLARFDHRKTDVWDDCQPCTSDRRGCVHVCVGGRD